METKTIAGDQGVIDHTTGLMWEIKKIGDENLTYTWDEAVIYAAKLNHSGLSNWRLPTIQELLSIVDYNRHSPAIAEVFTDIQYGFYWSSTTCAGNTTTAWYVDFNNGYVHYANKMYGYYARCVRSIKPTPDDISYNYVTLSVDGEVITLV